MTEQTAREDLYRGRAVFCNARRNPELVDLPEASFLVVDGEGSPDGLSFQDAVGALYSVAYPLKMTAKKQGTDFRVPTFEGSWSIGVDEQEVPRERWRWQLLMMVPDFVDESSVEAAKEHLAEKKKEPKAKLRFARIRQGLCVQILHIGPYDTAAESIEKMKSLMAYQGFRPSGAHHEVYLGDPRRAKPKALKTILRQPVERA